MFQQAHTVINAQRISLAIALAVQSGRMFHPLVLSSKNGRMLKAVGAAVGLSRECVNDVAFKVELSKRGLHGVYARNTYPKAQLEMRSREISLLK